MDTVFLEHFFLVTALLTNSIALLEYLQFPCEKRQAINT